MYSVDTNINKLYLLIRFVKLKTKKSGTVDWNSLLYHCGCLPHNGMISLLYTSGILSLKVGEKMYLDQYPHRGFLLPFIVIIIFLQFQFQLSENRYSNQITLQLLAKEFICVLSFLIVHMKGFLWNVGSFMLLLLTLTMCMCVCCSLKKAELWNHTAWIRIQALPPTTCMTLGKRFSPSFV